MVDFDIMGRSTRLVDRSTQLIMSSFFEIRTAAKYDQCVDMISNVAHKLRGINILIEWDSLNYALIAGSTCHTINMCIVI